MARRVLDAIDNHEERYAVGLVKEIPGDSVRIVDDELHAHLLDKRVRAFGVFGFNIDRDDLNRDAVGVSSPIGIVALDILFDRWRCIGARRAPEGEKVQDDYVALKIG